MLSGVLFWRGKDTAFQVMGGLGGVLLLEGLVLPGQTRNVRDSGEAEATRELRLSIERGR